MNPPNDVAGDSAGNIYAVDSLHKRVRELPTGSTTQVDLPFGEGVGNPEGGIAVDSGGNIYVQNH
jgi:serine/threonine protein kinase, bacterial